MCKDCGGIDSEIKFDCQGYTTQKKGMDHPCNHLLRCKVTLRSRLSKREAVTLYFYILAVMACRFLYSNPGITTAWKESKNLPKFTVKLVMLITSPDVYSDINPDF
jgi:hypothetical protein